MKKSFLLVLLLTSIISCAKKNDSNDETLDGLYQFRNCQNVVVNMDAPEYLSYRTLVRISGNKTYMAEQRFNEINCSGTSSLWAPCEPTNKVPICEYQDLQEHSTVQLSEFNDIPENFYLGIQDLRYQPDTVFSYFVFYQSPTTGDLQYVSDFNLEEEVTSWAQFKEKFPCDTNLGLSLKPCLDEFVANPDLGEDFTKITDIEDVPAPAPTNVEN